LVILSPQGKITSYLPGIDYPAPEFERALANARRGETGEIAKMISLLCFANDPVPGSPVYYVLIALRGGALATLAGLILITRLKPRRPDRKA
jgi:protein SCO1